MENVWSTGCGPERPWSTGFGEFGARENEERGFRCARVRVQTERHFKPVTLTIENIGLLRHKKATLAGGYYFETLLMKKIGGGERDRTDDLLLAKQAL
ncbi:hypothetical protein, partial [Candidatus Magnetominusculus xianensis]|uniref:hypothetical protein n=1 Tax=Candidatus Magnetominusculus xianensis TaxID=1748249 RepID=UPI001F243A6E